jgi:hypothetical protein
MVLSKTQAHAAQRHSTARAPKVGHGFVVTPKGTSRTNVAER